MTNAADKPIEKESATIRTVAVIELGTTSIRMVIAQIRKSGKFKVLDSLSQAVSLGRDSFASGVIDSATTESCVEALRSFRRVMNEYGIFDDRQIRAVATSAVRDAANQNAFLDRIFIATGIHVVAIDQTEVNRLTYLAVRPVLLHESFFKKSDTLVLEVGGGSTEAVVFRKGRVGNSHMYRLGALRLCQTIDDYQASRERRYEIVKSHIDQTVDQIAATILPTQSEESNSASSVRMVALGSETRFACSLLNPAWNRKGLGRIKVGALEKLARKFLKQTTDETVRQQKVTYQEAETLGPALLVYANVAKALKLRSILVGEASLRSGLLAEMGTGGAWTAEFKRQILNSAVATGKRYKIDLRHARHVAGYSRDLFDAIRKGNPMSARDEVILNVAALLHEVGTFISNNSHHKHSMYIILNSDIFGLGSRELLLVALVARYHRRALPKQTHEGYADLPRADRLTVSKLAAILRVANALDREHSHSQLKLSYRAEPGQLLISTDTKTDLTVVQHRVSERSKLFEQVYGMKVLMRQSNAG